MTALRKDGIPVVPICTDCVHFKDRTFPRCQSENRPGEFDPVYGYHRFSLRCTDARKSNDLCGTAGYWYKPVPSSPKPTYWSRIKGWLDK